MLIQDTPYLERKRVESTVIRTRELTKSALDHQRVEVAKNNPVDGLDPTKLEHQLGRPLWWKTMVQRVQKMNPYIQFQDSLANPNTTIAVLYPALEAEPTGGEKTVLRYLMAFDKIMLPEYTVLMPVYDEAWDSEKRDFVKTLRTTKFMRGWREILRRLLDTNLVTHTDVDELFPTYSNVRKSWHDWKQAEPLHKQREIQIVGG